MHGEIKLQRWLPFVASQVITSDHEFIWRATMRVHGLPVTGFDRLLDGNGKTRWNLLGIVPVATGSGADITRSDAGRAIAESVWLPSALLRGAVSWSQCSGLHPSARITVLGETADLQLTVDPEGRLQSLRMLRWGNPNSQAFRYVDFGAIVNEERTFQGYTVPTKLRIGYYIDSDRFESDGEFIRITIDDAVFQ